jgi:steroid 5-alpha reductase family enzyme
MAMSSLQLLLVNLALIGALMTVLWIVSLRTRNVAVVDIFWGLGFVLIAWMSWWQIGWTGPRQWLLLGTTSLWGLRLAGYLTWRNWGRPEDHRYAAMRARHAKHFGLFSAVWVFGLQGLLMWIVSWPVQMGQQSSGPLTLLDGVGGVVWLIGWLTESVGDWQLVRFRRDPANVGRVLDRGLWRYTRHPNYFGDFLTWWAVFLIAFAAGGNGWTIISPLLMSFLLLRVSGVSLLERDITERRPEYAEYMRRTSPFVPWPPRRDTAHLD